MIRTYIVEVSDDIEKDAFERFERYWSPEGELIRCKDCKHRGEWKRGDFSYVEFPDGSKCPGQSEDPFYSWRPDDDWFCAEGERLDNTD